MTLIDHEGLHARGINYSRAHIWRLVRDGKFPRPVKLGVGRNAWLDEEITAWIEARVRERDERAKAAEVAA